MLWSYQSQALWGDACCSPSHTSCRRKGELWTRTCSLSSRGPSEPGNWAARPFWPPSLRWRAGESGTEPQSHPGNEAETGGTGAAWGRKHTRTGYTPDTHRNVWICWVQQARTFHCTLDMLDPGAIMETLSKETRRADSSLWRSFCSVLAASG